jgi:hypothetical protein
MALGLRLAIRQKFSSVSSEWTLPEHTAMEDMVSACRLQKASSIFIAGQFKLTVS